MFLRSEYVFNSFIISFPIEINVGLLKQAELVSMFFFVYKIMCKIIPMFCKVKNLCGLFYNWLTEVVLARKCIVRLLDVVTLEQK